MEEKNQNFSIYDLIKPKPQNLNHFPTSNFKKEMDKSTKILTNYLKVLKNGWNS